MNSMQYPSLEQMTADADYLHKLRGYCYKVADSINDLPDLNAYEELVSMLFMAQEIARAEQVRASIDRDAIKLPPDIDWCKRSMYDIGRICANLMGYIQQIGGPKMLPRRRRKIPQREISRREHNARIYEQMNLLREQHEDEQFNLPADVSSQIEALHGQLQDHSPRAEKRPSRFMLSSRSFEDIKVILGPIEDAEKKFFLRRAQEDINHYLQDAWYGAPNRENDLDRLETLLRQVDRVLDNIGDLCEIVVSERYKHADNFFMEDDLRRCISNTWVLYDATCDAIESIKNAPRHHKPLEFELIDQLAYSFWTRTGKKPSGSHVDCKFMKLLSVIEDELDNFEKPVKGDSTPPRQVNRFGRELVEKVIAQLPTPQTKKSAKPA